MKIEPIFIIYLVIINIASGILFSYDKHAARLNHRRVPERTLHILEMLGGVFANVILMYSIHHKNRKFRYYGVTWMVMMGWLIVMMFGFSMPF
jgi:uncharacterized membrane protein YsdA (DUF1294 family)